MAIALSRFALLKIEDDIDSDEEKQSKQSGQNKNQQNAKKKKKNKKKGGQSDAAELKSMAFGVAKPAKKANNLSNGNSQPTTTSAEVPPKQWEEWKKIDVEATDDSYEKDLQQALLMSRLEQEETKVNVPTDQTSSAGENGASKKKKNKKKKKTENMPMTLEEFNQRQAKTKPEETDGPEYEVMPKAPKANTSLPKDAQPDKEYFSQVEKAAQRIIQQEHIQEEYRKQYASGTVINAQFQRELEKKDAEILQLRKDNKGLLDIMSLFREELQQVKDQNQKLRRVLAQGEMKEKAELQVQLDQLQQTHQELTDQLMTLTTDHEKEKSKNHTLQAENLKLKAGKHK